MDEKTLKIQLLVEAVGEEQATIMQQNDDVERAQHFEDWYKKEVLGHRSSYKPE